VTGQIAYYFHDRKVNVQIDTDETPTTEEKATSAGTPKKTESASENTKVGTVIDTVV
jgi:hypothetical protein